MRCETGKFLRFDGLRADKGGLVSREGSDFGLRPVLRRRVCFSLHLGVPFSWVRRSVFASVRRVIYFRRFWTLATSALIRAMAREITGAPHAARRRRP